MVYTDGYPLGEPSVSCASTTVLLGVIVPDPHPWLGLDYRDLLPGLASGQHRFTLSLTRPNGYCHGSGVLRVVQVKDHESICHCVLAYERYHSAKPRYAARSGGQGGASDGAAGG